MAGMGGEIEAFLHDIEEQRDAWVEFDKQTRELEKGACRSPNEAALGGVIATANRLRMLEQKYRQYLGISFASLLQQGYNLTLRFEEIETNDYFYLLSELAEFQCLLRILEHAQREDVTAEGLCEKVLQERAGYPARLAFTIYVLREEADRSDKPKLVPGTLLATALSACVAARTKLSGERWDRKGLRERLAETGEKPSRELLSQLPAEVISVFDEFLRRGEGTKRLDPTLQHLSNEAVRRLRRVGMSRNGVGEVRQDSRDFLEEASEAREEQQEGSQEPRPRLGEYLETTRRLGEEPEFEAAFIADQLQQIKEESGVSEQQWESFEAATRLGSNEKAAEELKRSAQQVGKEKFEALKKLRRVAGL